MNLFSKTDYANSIDSDITRYEAMMEAFNNESARLSKQISALSDKLKASEKQSAIASSARDALVKVRNSLKSDEGERNE